MATYAAYRHIELDNVGYSKKRVRNPSSEIFNVMCTPSPNKSNGSHTPRRSSQHSDSFTHLFGSPNSTRTPPRRASLTKHDVTNRNPVTGNGVVSWDTRPGSRNTPRMIKERNPVTGDAHSIASPAVTPTKSYQNGFAHVNGSSTPMQNGNHEPSLSNGNMSNGDI